MLNSKSIGQKIADARKKLQLSQAELAQRVSISPQAVGKWERGESMPDIPTLNRLAEILGVDLNYFSDRYSSAAPEPEPADAKTDLPAEAFTMPKPRKRFDWNWDMSRGNWADADFSGLKNLKEKFSSSNMKNCKFRDADLSELTLAKNNIELCDFTASDLRNSKIQYSNLQSNQYNQCAFVDAEFYRSNIGKCDFSEADFSGAEFYETNFGQNTLNNAVWKFTAFKRSNIDDTVFEGTFEDCHFEHCTFYGVKFQNAVLRNTFFKYNSRFKKVQFIDCRVDKITYAFLKNNQADLSGVTIIP